MLTQTKGGRERVGRDKSLDAYCCGNQDGGGTILEAPQCILPLNLTAVAMDACARIAPGIQEVIQRITTFLSLNKDQGEGVLS